MRSFPVNAFLIAAFFLHATPTATLASGQESKPAIEQLRMERLDGNLTDIEREFNIRQGSIMTGEYKNFLRQVRDTPALQEVIKEARDAEIGIYATFHMGTSILSVLIDVEGTSNEQIIEFIRNSIPVVIEKRRVHEELRPFSLKYALIQGAIDIYEFRAFIRRVEEDKNLKDALLRVRNKGYRSHITFHFNVLPGQSVFIDHKATNDEIVKFICGQNPCPEE